MIDSLRFRFAATSVAIVGLVLGACSLSTVVLYERQARHDFDLRLRRHARALSVPVLSSPGAVDALDDEVSAALGLAGSAAVIRDGVEVARFGRVDAAEAPPAIEGFATRDVDGTPWRFATVAGVGPEPVLVQVGAPLSDLERSVDTVRILASAIGSIGVVASIGAGWLLSGWLERPLVRLQSGATGITSTDELHQRVPVEGPTELRHLALAMNAMLERLDRSASETALALESARAFAADVAHELRTPLASLRVNIDALLSDRPLGPADRTEAVEQVGREQARLVALLDGLRLLALSGQPGTVPASEIDLADLVDRRAQAARARHPEDTVDVSIEPASFDLFGWEQGLEALVDNLLANAQLHGRRGHDPVRVEVSLGHDAAGCVLLVDDDGPGVPPAERAEVFDRFVRRSRTTTGSGLGLTLVDRLARLHRGSAAVLESPRGGARLAVHLRSLEAELSPPGRRAGGSR